MVTNSGKTWKDINELVEYSIKEYLIKNGGLDMGIKSEHEEWQIKFSDSTFIFYKKGTLYSTPSKSLDPAIYRAWEFIDSLFNPRYVLPSRDYLLGFDETGKGEVFGHTMLGGVIFPRALFSQLEQVVGNADTKKSHSAQYWDNIFIELDKLKKDGFDFLVEKIPPWQVDKYNYNKLLDITYQRLLNQLYRFTDFSKTRIVVDDYKIGDTLDRYLRALEKQGAEIIVVSNSESQFLEAKVASLIAKRNSQMMLESIRKSPEYTVNGINIGSGNAGDPLTIAWLDVWKKTGNEWPWFVKQSFKNIREIDGRGEVKKLAPPINESLLSQEFREEFANGNLSIKSLSLVCPFCGAVLKSVKLTFTLVQDQSITELRCNDCNNTLPDAGITLRYYCGYLLPDTNAMMRRYLSRDLSRSQLFENFKVILSSIVRGECDGKSGSKQELEQLQTFSSKGMITIESVGSLQNAGVYSNTKRDEMIIQDCLKHNAILLSADKSMQTFAIGKGVFTING